MTHSQIPAVKGVRSYVRREGRITVAQKRALQQLWACYVTDAAADMDWPVLFGRKAPLFIEIGCGYGEALAALALAQPENNYVGFEVYTPGVGALLNKLDSAQITNARVVCADAALWLPQMIADDTLAGVYVFFPDPWPKKRHHKRRLLNPAFVALLAQKIMRGGFFHMATDWQSYADATNDYFLANACFERMSEAEAAKRLAARPHTRFAERGINEGRGTTDIIFQRIT
ncbi:tRNA (guanosine(46)-N7)-methyltransferase TrmB [Candidatus Persebacteraceae bacterium Df01]|jgi:tRNA (guanine-N7-)-methyltransferase|uniref:tRNA (guanine-N(7)-)-methyltransferase n=1 Tax=Candidatus Doriopsillibacter californiensis TaxID=2970740 RepID=A0ABT7QL53_9GAMM|nr:tRNA (guanosine(46)-N7)-methyltransferase TrmB [Candidatus Persebacteraceae bacterium Df01]